MNAAATTYAAATRYTFRRCNSAKKPLIVCRYIFEVNATVVKNLTRLASVGASQARVKVSALGLEIRLNKFGTGVDVDLSQRRLARIAC